MKNIIMKALNILLIIVVANVMGQTNKLITGTVGKEHMVGKKLVICELGTQACMFVDVDPTLEISINGKKYKPQELQVGWYLLAEVSLGKGEDRVIRRLDVNPNKTIICFTELDEYQSSALENRLQKINGIKQVKTYIKSRQVYIEYDQKTITYPEIENYITDLGYKIE
jgi:copper chaperone CopZ